MTFMARTLGYSVSLPALGIMSLSAINNTNNSTIAVTLALNTDGTITGTASGTTTNVSVPTNWYSPTTTSIGSSYYVKYTLNSGNTWSGGLVSGTVYQLSAVRSITWTSTGVGAPPPSKLANVTVNIYSDAGGTNLVSTGTLDISLN